MFDIRQKVVNEWDEQDEEKVGLYLDGLMEEFAASPEAGPLIEAHGNVSWPGMMMEYGFGHLGVSPAEMTLRDFNEIVFTLFPRKVSVEPEKAEEIIEELRAFWTFVGRQYGLANARAILSSLDSGAAERLQQLLADPSLYGMAKGFFMAGMKAGYDMTTEEGLQAFQLDYNAARLADLDRPPAIFDFQEGEDTGGWAPAVPSPLTHEERADKRKDRKRERQAKKKNRRKR
jgi:hypothetical protein